jgi:putative NADPH-quinone reductase
MTKAMVINGSPSMEKGLTATVLSPFIKGMSDAGCEVELEYASRLKIKPCACGEMYCWYVRPGECCIQDQMQALMPKLKAADILILATPVYIPLPGAMQDLVNRLCPLINPVLEYRAGRTRARFRDDVQIRQIGLVSTGGWWERANMDTVVRIAEELAEDASVQFAGAVLRPHANLMKVKGELTSDGQAVLDAAKRAGFELVSQGAVSRETLDAVSRPLISEEELRRRYNQIA